MYIYSNNDTACRWRVINPAVGCHYFPPGLQLNSTLATLKRAATKFAAWWTQAQWVWTLCLRLLAYPTASRLRFEPRPFCAWVQHANHSAADGYYPSSWFYIPTACTVNTNSNSSVFRANSKTLALYVTNSIIPPQMKGKFVKFPRPRVQVAAVCLHYPLRGRPCVGRLSGC